MRKSEARLSLRQKALVVLLHRDGAFGHPVSPREVRPIGNSIALSGLWTVVFSLPYRAVLRLHGLAVIGTVLARRRSRRRRPAFCLSHLFVDRFGSLADMAACPRDVRFTPIADINDMSGAATAGERGVSLSAGVLQRWRHSTGSHCRSHDCLPKYCLCGSNLRTSHTGSPNSYYLSLIGSPRTRGPGKPGPAVARKTLRQDQLQRWQLNSCGSLSTSVLPEPADFHANAARNKLPFGAPRRTALRKLKDADVRFGSLADIPRRDQPVRFVP